MKAGYTDVYVYQEGFPAWKKAGHPVETLDILPNVEVPGIAPEALKALIDEKTKVVVVDIRDREDRKEGGIAGSLNIPLDDLMSRYGEIPKGSKVILIDRAGKQTPIAGRYLAKQGFPSVQLLEGGIVGGWIAAGLPVKQ